MKRNIIATMINKLIQKLILKRMTLVIKKYFFGQLKIKI